MKNKTLLGILSTLAPVITLMNGCAIDNLPHEVHYFGTSFGISNIDKELHIKETGDYFDEGVFTDENFIFDEKESNTYTILDKSNKEVAKVRGKERNVLIEEEVILKTNQENPTSIQVKDETDRIIIRSDNKDTKHSFGIIVPHTRTKDLVVEYSNVTIENSGAAPAITNFSPYPISIKTYDNCTLDGGEMPEAGAKEDDLKKRAGNAIMMEIGTYYGVYAGAIAIVYETIRGVDPRTYMDDAWFITELALQNFLDSWSSLYWGETGNKGPSGKIPTILSLSPVTVFGQGRMYITGTKGGKGGKGQSGLFDGGNGGNGGDGGVAINCPMALINSREGVVTVRGGLGGEGGEPGKGLKEDGHKGYEGKRGEMISSKILYTVS